MLLLVTPNEMLGQGLTLVGHKESRLGRLSKGKKEELFRADFGKDPIVLTKVWEALQTTSVPNAKIHQASEKDLSAFLWTFHWMTCYPTEASLESRTGWCDKVIRERLKAMVKKIALLKSEKIVWPASWSDPNAQSPIFLCSVDGTHCPIQEPTKGHKYSKNPKYYSHKHNQAGLAYEVAISIFTNRVVWISKPYPAGTKDPDIFADHLKNLIPKGKKVIADNAYKRIDFPMISLTNKADSPAVRLFKRRVRARHESFFGKMKVFDVLTTVFRHGEEHHNTCFLACAVACQFQIDVTPLFDP